MSAEAEPAPQKRRSRRRRPVEKKVVPQGQDAERAASDEGTSMLEPPPKVFTAEDTVCTSSDEVSNLVDAFKKVHVPEGDLEKGSTKLCAQQPCASKISPIFAVWLLSQALVGFILFASPTVMLMSFCALMWKSRVSVMASALTMVVCLGLSAAPFCMACCLRRSCGKALQIGRAETYFAMLCVLGGVGGFGAVFRLLLTKDLSSRVLRADFDNSKPVAVVGAGASGLTASWMLAMGGRRVELFEALDDVGGHSQSWTEVRGKSSGGNLTIDLGYVFSNHGYDMYHHLTDHYGAVRADSAMNTSGAWRGRCWDNTGTTGRFHPELEEEIERFMGFVRDEPRKLRYLVPFAAWAWRHGFSEEFLHLVLHSTMSVIFVTGVGLSKHSTQAVLDKFREGVAHLRYQPHTVQGKPKVQFTEGGSHAVWKRFLTDILATGRVQLHLKTSVKHARKEGGLWVLTTEDGAGRAGRANGFSDVVLALPANVAKRVVRGAPLQSAILSQIQYDEAEVTLHTDYAHTLGPSFGKAASEVLFFVEDGHMTSRIGKIFGEPSSNLLLTVHKGIGIDPATVKWRTTWKHHYVNLWETAIAHKLLPFFNGNDGLQYAGDWVWGLGHNDAMRAGVAAACRAGILRTAEVVSHKQLYDQFISFCT